MADDHQIDLSSRDRRAEHLTTSRTFTGVAGYVAAGAAVLGLIASNLVGLILSNAGLDAAFLTMNAISVVMLVASGAVVVGLLLQWLWLRAPGQPGSVPLLIGLLLMWGWGRLQNDVDLWGFQSYPGSLEWSNPDIRVRLVVASVVSLLVWVVELVMLILGSYRMLRAKRSQVDLPQAEPASGGEGSDREAESSEPDDGSASDKQP